MATDTPITATTSTGAHRLPAYLALAAGVICISWSAIFVRWTDIPGPASAFYRLLIPALVLFPTSFFEHAQSRLSRRNLGIIALGGLFFALDLALYNTSILRTTAANATVLGNCSPIVVGLLTWLLFRCRARVAFWLGLLLAVSGSVLIVWADLASHNSRTWPKLRQRWQWRQRGRLLYSKAIAHSSPTPTPGKRIIRLTLAVNNRR